MKYQSDLISLLTEQKLTVDLAGVSELANARILTSELAWLEQCINYRINAYFQQEGVKPELTEPDALPQAPNLPASGGEFVSLLQQLQLNTAERLVLILALATYLKPQLLDIFFAKNVLYQRIYTEFGGIHAKVHGGFLPTIETGLFLLAGQNLAERLSYMALFRPGHRLFQQGILASVPTTPDEPFNAAILVVSAEAVERHILGLSGKVSQPVDFPAHLLTTQKSWSDLVLTGQTASQLEELQAWLEFGEQLLTKEGAKQFKPGYRCLFYGPPGTGKTFTARLLAKQYGRQVYRVDLSQLVSKYIGETEKNFEKVFIKAEKNNWILFFDEADALFAKRSQINSSNDRYANQSTAYLLQRIEDCPNVVILASNLKDNFDQAFIRRFQSFVYFPLPGKRERLQLWQQGLNHSSVFQPPAFSLDSVAGQFELPGGVISNVIRFVSLMALKNNTTEISLSDLKKGIRRELAKEGKSL